jgi:Cytochrome c oxidase assembly protein CtaG/Cox11
MPQFLKEALLFIMTVVILVLPPVLWFETALQHRDDRPVRVLNDYLKFLYARDFHRAYNFISADDRQFKSQGDYVRERGPFTGFALEVARKLASLIEAHPVDQQAEGNRDRIRLALKLPDANALSGLLLDWDEQRLNNLPASQQRKLLSTIDALRREKKLPMIEGDEEFVLTRENSRWKIYLDWAAGVRVNFATTLPDNGLLVAAPTIEKTVVRSGEQFTVGFKVKNLGSREIVTRIVHRIEPKDLAEYLDLVECALLLPVRLRPGEEQVFNSTYVVRGDLPDNTKAFDVTYEFKIES